MKAELTPRDKKLIVFLISFVIVVGFGYWGIKPLSESIDQTRIDIETEQELRDVNDLKISMLPGVKEANEKLEVDIVKAREKFYPPMEADEVDRWFTGMALDYGLTVYSMDINISREEVKPQAYVYSEKFKNGGLHAEEGYVEGTGTTTDVESVDNYAQTGYTDFYEEEVDAATGIRVTTLTMRLEGPQVNLQKLIDDLSASDERHLLKSYSWASGTDMKRDENGEFVVEQRNYLNLVLELYECDK